MTKRRSDIAGFLLLLVFWVGAAEQMSGADAQEQVTLKWLGTAGWEIQFGKTVILIDPFLTRKDWRSQAEWKTDEEAVLKVIKGADYIFAGHSHGDHIGDIPFIAKRFGSKVIGSRTTTNLALTAGVDKSRVVTISGGENLITEQFSVRVIESRHGILSRLGRKGPPRTQEILQPRNGPITGADFVEGGCYLYYFTFGRHKVLHQSTGNFIEEKLKGLNPDVALLFPAHPYDLTSVLKTINPKVIVLHHFDRHFDEQRAPFSRGIPEANVKRAQRFQRDVGSIDSQIKVIIPQILMTYTLEE